MTFLSPGCVPAAVAITVRGCHEGVQHRFVHRGESLRHRVVVHGLQTTRHVRMQQHVRRAVHLKTGDSHVLCQRTTAPSCPGVFAVPVSTCVHRMLVMALGVVEWQDLEDALFDFPEVWARLTVEARQRMEVRF